MFLRIRGFLSKPKDYQRVQYIWKYFKLEPAPKDEVEKKMDKYNYELMQKNPNDFILDPLEFRDSPEYSDYKKPKKRPRPHFFTRVSSSPDQYDISLNGIKKKMLAFKRDKIKNDQVYNVIKVQELGPDLAAAQFIISRNGGVKFLGHDGFVRSSPRGPAVLPNYKDDNYKVEAIDASGMPLMYEGLQNLSNLKYLKWLCVRGNLEFDNWCFDRLSLISPNLEYLDVSECKKLTHNAFSCCYRFKNLKCLNVEGTNDSNAFKFACLTLESQYPELVVVGLVLKPEPKSVFSSY